MNKYLIEILKLRTSLTLPGFGALMIANSKTGKIVLNQLLKYDDKVLAKFIAEKENIDLQEAQNKVSQFVKEIDLDLSKGETYDIFQFGKLSKTENGSILFEMDESMKKNQDSPIVSTPKAVKEPIIKSGETVPKVEVPVVEKKEVVQPIIKEKEKEDVKITPAKIEPKSIEKVAEVKKDKVVEKPIVEKKEVKQQLAKKPVEQNVKPTYLDPKVIVGELVSSKSETKTLSEKEKLKLEKEVNKKWQNTKLGDEDEKKKRKIWPWILVLLLIGFGIFAFMFQDKLKAILGMSHKVEQVDDVTIEEHNDEEVVEEIAPENVIIDTLSQENEETVESEIAEEVIEEVVDNAPVIPSSTSGSFHIIGGAFGEESNANAFATKTGGTVIGRFDGMYQVAVKSYDTKDEVNAAIKSVSSEYSGAWIFKYPK